MPVSALQAEIAAAAACSFDISSRMEFSVGVRSLFAAWPFFCPTLAGVRGLLLTGRSTDFDLVPAVCAVKPGGIIGDAFTSSRGAAVAGLPGRGPFIPWNWNWVVSCDGIGAGTACSLFDESACPVGSCFGCMLAGGGGAISGIMLGIGLPMGMVAPAGAGELPGAADVAGVGVAGVTGSLAPDAGLTFSQSSHGWRGGGVAYPTSSTALGWGVVSVRSLHIGPGTPRFVVSSGPRSWR